MNLTPREIVLRTLAFDHPPRAPRQLWVLPWAELHHPGAFDRIQAEFPPDIVYADGHQREPRQVQGSPYERGVYIDEWGCRFTNIQPGVHGEVCDPLIRDWDDAGAIRFPREMLTIDPEAVNRDCEASDRFQLVPYCPRPFERLQFLRGSQALYLDLMMRPPAMLAFLRKLHGFYCEFLELWCSRTQVDAIMFMDDWGSQRNLLIAPELWCELFKPLYRDYIEIAHAHGKKAFMHSDGYIVAIYPHLIELGLDALNSQIFCMGVENLRPFAGKITFWGEIDRQQLLPHGSLEQIDAAVESVYHTLWRGGGCIAQCEFGPGGKPENVRRVFEAWDRLTSPAMTK
ncbi:MAG TPA: uroporphyrinogen decarboxylase family protein [Candidatus Sumerlaeota bacterium]|nr:uroporphyrinogen decarboxylase family protein [Candidatus Sumerlaeota bacterium]